tara:strand:- start:5122 stop:5463 length:342 start_codon:yes stop_codon:yes gene_type:complete
MTGPPSGWQSADEATLQAMAESNQTSPCTQDTPRSLILKNADWVVGLLSAAHAASIIFGAASASSVGEGVGTAILANVVATGVFTLSARSGGRKILDCEKFQRKLRESLVPVR